MAKPLNALLCSVFNLTWLNRAHICESIDVGRNCMAEIVKLGTYDPNNLASVAFLFGRKGEDAPVLALLEQGADLNAADRFGYTALHRAVQFDRQAVVRALLEAGADPNVFTDAEVMGREEGCSTTNALMHSAGNGHIEAVKLLLQYGADPLARSNADLSALDVVRRGVKRRHKQAQIEPILPLLEAAVRKS